MQNERNRYETFEDFKNDNPDYKIPQEIDCVEFIVTKEFAESVANGERVVDIREISECEDVISKEVLQYIEQHKNNPEVLDWCNPIRNVLSLRYRDVENSWHLDVECTYNGEVSPSDDEIDWLYKRFNCCDLDELCASFNKTGVAERPAFFYFALGKILEKSNL